MSLNIYWDYDTIPSNLKVMKFNDSYFNGNVLLEDTQEVRMLLKNIDDAEYLSPQTFISCKHRDRGGLFRQYLSTGCKTALSVILSSEKNNLCIDSIEMGTNAWNELIKLNKGNVLLKYTSVLHEDEEPCDILFEGIHCTTFGDFISTVSEYEDRL